MKIVLYGVGLLIALLILLTKSRRMKFVLSMPMIIIIIFLMSNFSIINLDNLHYQIYYEMSQNGQVYEGFEKGYNLLASYIASFGADYWKFRYIFIGIFVVLMYFLIMNMTDNYGFFYITYFLYGIFRDAEQIRSFAGTVIIFLGMYIMINTKGIVRIILFGGSVVLAAQFHQSMWAFLLLLLFLMPRKYHDIFFKGSIIITMVFTIIVMIDKQLITNILRIVDPRREEHYTEVTSHFGFLIIAFLFLLNLFLFRYIKDKCDKKNIYYSSVIKKITSVFPVFKIEYVNKNFNINYLMEILDFFNIISIFTIPLLTINTHFYRIGRSIFIFDMIYFVDIMKVVDNKKEKILLYGGVFVILSGYFLFDFYLSGSISQQFLPFFIK